MSKWLVGWLVRNNICRTILIIGRIIRNDVPFFRPFFINYLFSFLKRFPPGWCVHYFLRNLYLLLSWHSIIFNGLGINYYIFLCMCIYNTCICVFLINIDLLREKKNIPRLISRSTSISHTSFWLLLINGYAVLMTFCFLSLSWLSLGAVLKPLIVLISTKMSWPC